MNRDINCKKLEGDYTPAAEYFKTYDPPVLLAVVNGIAETALASTYAITDYPTLIMFRHGRRYDYKSDNMAGHGMTSYF